MVCDADELAKVRIDKNAHIGLVSALQLHRRRFWEYRVKDTETFKLTGWSEREAARYIRSMYYIFYASRFKTPQRIVKKAVPIAPVWPKKK